MKLIDLALVLCATGCSGLPKLNTSDHLYVNTTETHYQVKKSKEAGEKDLQSIVMTSELEEAWVFNPVDSLWIEIGSSESPSSILYDGRIINHLIQTNKKPIIYHIHPAKSLEIIDKNYKEHSETEKRCVEALENPQISQGSRINIIKQLLSAVDQKKTSKLIIISQAFPSETDILSGNTYNFGITQAVVSKFGITEWKSNQKRINDYLSSYNLIQRTLMGTMTGENEKIITALVSLLNTTQDQITLSYRPWINNNQVPYTKLVFRDSSRR